MKVLFVRPLWNIYNYLGAPPLGAMYLAASARERVTPKPEFRIYHMPAEGATMGDYRRFLEEYKPDIVGFSVLSFEARGFAALAPITKDVLPDSFVMVGGPHASIFPDLVLNHPEVDLVAIGEAENTFCELLDRLQSGKDWRDVRGIAYRIGDKNVYNRPMPPVENVDNLPYPAWDLIDIKKYRKLLTLNGFVWHRDYMPIFTSRSCPYGCIYCHRIFGKKVRLRSAENVIREIECLYHDHGIREFHVFDDIFNWDINRAKDICRGIIQRGLDIKIAFPNGVRSDLFDDELIDLMAEAGVWSMTFAIETASPRLQSLIRKNLDLDKARYYMNKAFDAGIIPASFYMIGFPTETPSEVKQTIRFAQKSKALKASFFTVLAYPKTGLYDLAIKTQPKYEINEDTFKDFSYWSPVSCNNLMTGDELTKLSRKGMRRFYLNPWRIWHILKRYPKNRWYLIAFLQAFRMFGIGRIMGNIRARLMRVHAGLEESPAQMAEKKPDTDYRDSSHGLSAR